MGVPQLSVLYEDNHLLVVDKPAGISTMGTEPARPTLARLAAAYLKHKYHKPGNVYVGIVSRLDRLVTGVLVLARTSKAAGRLSDQIRRRLVEKRYLACLEGDLGEPLQGWQDACHWICKDERRQRMRIASAAASGAQEARLRFQVVACESGMSLVEIDLDTGRKHQIRLQMSALGHPVLGDQKYGSTHRFPLGIALHCHRVRIEHPTQKSPLEFSSSPLRHWQGKVPKSLSNAVRVNYCTRSGD